MTSSMSGFKGPTGLGTGQASTGKNFREKIPSGYKAGALQQFTPEQMQLFQQMFSQVSPDSYLSRLAGGDEELFSQMEEPALRQFSQLQGGLASRFSQGGGSPGGRQQALGARRSSGFQNTTNQYASDFAKDLAGKRQELQRQAIMDLMGLSENLLGQRPYERFLTQKEEKKSGLGGLLGAGIGGLAGSFTGRPLTGANLGYDIGSSF